MKTSNLGQRNQRGATLIITLVMLVLIMLVSISANSVPRPF